MNSALLPALRCNERIGARDRTGLYGLAERRHRKLVRTIGPRRGGESEFMHLSTSPSLRPEESGAGRNEAPKRPCVKAYLCGTSRGEPLEQGIAATGWPVARDDRHARGTHVVRGRRLCGRTPARGQPGGKGALPGSDVHPAKVLRPVRGGLDDLRSLREAVRAAAGAVIHSGQLQRPRM